MRVIQAATYAYVALALLAPSLGVRAAWLKPVGFWLGAALAAVQAWLALPFEAARFSPVWLLASLAVGNLSALTAFAFADYSPRHGVDRLVRFYRYLPRRFDAKAFALLTALAVYEELIWRGAVHQALGTSPGGIALTAVAFSLAHLAPNRKLRLPTHLELCVFSALCSTLVVITNTILPAILVHVVRNWACHMVRYEHDLAYRYAANRVLTTDRSRDDARRAHLPAVSD